mgnify:CR=1 FL=1
MANIKIMALGGLGEQGKNMYVVEINNNIFVLDAGIKYPEIDMFGVDAVVPDISYLIENKKRIQGVFLSHGHEDNIGAIPYLLERIPVRVYGTHYTLSLVEDNLKMNKMDIKKYKLYRINDKKVLTFDDVTVSFFNTTHSVPESVGIALQTEDGTIVYATDFNFNPETESYYKVSYEKITDIGKEKVLAVLSESVGTSSLGRPSDFSNFEYKLNNILNNTEKRVIIAAYSEDLLRVQKAINIALQKEKKIAFIGKGSERLVNFARNTNYINIDEESLVNLKYIDEHNKNNIKDLVVFVTGVRNEPYSALNRMVKHEDRLIHIEKGDSIVIVCPPKSGSELYVTNVINELYRSDASITIFDKNDIFGTHATNADLKTLYSILKPKFAMPIKGEYRHMYDHSQVLLKMGYNKEDILTLENGEMIEIVNGEIVNIEKKSLSDIFVNGSLVGGVNEKVIKDRETLSEQGIVIVNVAYDVRTRKLINDPSIITKGFTYKLSEEQLDEIVSNITVKIVNNTLLKKSFHVEQLKEVLQTEISNQLFRYTKHRPIIMISITEVNKPKAKE